MNTLVIYDSQFGNTQKVAEAIAQALRAKSAHVNDAKPEQLEGLDLLVVGSPTQGGQPKTTTLDFLKSIPNGSLKNIKAATFDTRFAPQDHGFGLRLLMKVIGFAAPKAASLLRAKGATVVATEGFIVNDKEGPLKDGELDRASQWASSLKNS